MNIGSLKNTWNSWNKIAKIFVSAVVLLIIFLVSVGQKNETSITPESVVGATEPLAVEAHIPQAGSAEIDQAALDKAPEARIKASIDLGEKVILPSDIEEIANCWAHFQLQYVYFQANKGTDTVTLNKAKEFVDKILIKQSDLVVNNKISQKDFLDREDYLYDRLVKENSENTSLDSLAGTLQACGQKYLVNE